MIALVLAAATLAADTNHFVVCPTLPPTSDTASQTIYGRVSDPFTRLDLPAGFSGVVAEAVRAKMPIPATLPSVVFDGRGRPTVVTTAAFSLAATGVARNIAVMASSSSTTIDSMLIKGIDGAAKDSSYPPLPPRAGNGVRLAFTMSTDSAAGAVPMFSIRLPSWRSFAPARSPVNKTHGRAINTAVRGELDTLVVSIIIDEKGVPLLGTADIERAPERRFAMTYLDWFRESRFVPGHIQQCAVRSRIQVKGTMNIQDQFMPAY
jgi:hypothetical protein